MDDTYSLVGTMDAKENELLEQRRARSSMIGSLVQAGAIAAFIRFCISGAIGSSVTRRTFTEVAQAHDQLLKSNELLTQQISRSETAEAQLRQAQKMEAIGNLSGGIAHDFNNMLGVMAGSLDLIRRRIAANDFRIERYINAAQEAAKRAAALTQRLLAFARQQPLEPKVLDAAPARISTMPKLLRSLSANKFALRRLARVGCGHLRPMQINWRTQSLTSRSMLATQCRRVASSRLKPPTPFWMTTMSARTLKLRRANT